jgi:hypothetical protein
VIGFTIAVTQWVELPLQASAGTVLENSHRRRCTLKSLFIAFVSSCLRVDNHAWLKNPQEKT